MVEYDNKGGAYLFGSHRSLARLPELLNHPGVALKLLLAPYKDDRQASAENA